MTSVPQIVTCRAPPKYTDTSSTRAASLPPIAVLEDLSFDADDEGDGDDEIVSMTEIYTRDFYPRPVPDLVQRLGTPPPAIKVPKPLDLFGPLSPLSELTPSEDDEEPIKPISKQHDAKFAEPCTSETSETSTQSSINGKRKRSSSFTSASSLLDEPPSKKHISPRSHSSSQDDSNVSVDAVSTPKRRCGLSRTPLGRSTAAQTDNNSSLTLVEVRQSLRRHAKTFGRIRKSTSASKHKVGRTRR